MAQAITDPEELLRRLDLPRSLLPGARIAARDFGLRVPQAYLELMHKSDPDDPLLRQVLPIADELRETPGFSDDPVGDCKAAQGAGMLSKYQGRTLLIASAACAIHCRYCFRRAFPYSEHQAGRNGWREALAILRHRTDISEVILSGGDPLAMDDARLARLTYALAEIPHLRRLRIHTRLPVVIPRRITPALIRLLGETRLRTAIVLHFNHPRELDGEISCLLERLRKVVTLLNQSVLLRGVNDDAGTLSRLSEHLFDTGVLPYYLHLLDRVQGAAHFQVTEGVARSLMDELRLRLPGYLTPRLVKEQEGAPAKTLVA
jgi:EF-P beta-lysylation protein EpmB